MKRLAAIAWARFRRLWHAINIGVDERGFPTISRLERWRHLIHLRLGKWWRRQCGIIRLEFSACRCVDCGHKDAYYRLGCRCWKSTAAGKRIMEYGWFLENSFAGDNFMTNELLYQTVKAGVHVQHADGRRVTIDEFEEEK